MKKNLLRLSVAGLLAMAWLLYLHWNKERVENSPETVAINCVSNLKQVGLAFRLWAGDHGGQFPFNVSTNAGGTRELCEVGKDGFDRNAYLHFQVMSNELASPLVLVCPQDQAKIPATSWASLQMTNVTYQLRTGTNLNEASPHEILAVCPVDGNILYCDGSVAEGKPAAGNQPAGPTPMRVQ